jgi:anti-sigma factor (TIGR02949 family)
VVVVKTFDCEQALKRLLEFVDQELTDEDREGVERHLRTCRSCFSRMEFERQLKGKIHDLARETVSPAVEDRIKALMKGF